MVVAVPHTLDEPDRMPVPLPEPGGAYAAHNYNQPILPLYDEDTAQKYELIRDTLRNCDYVALATNRLWRTPGQLDSQIASQRTHVSVILPRETSQGESRHLEVESEVVMGMGQMDKDMNEMRMNHTKQNEMDANEETKWTR